MEAKSESPFLQRESWILGIRFFRDRGSKKRLHQAILHQMISLGGNPVPFTYAPLNPSYLLSISKAMLFLYFSIQRQDFRARSRRPFWQAGETLIQ